MQSQSPNKIFVSRLHEWVHRDGDFERALLGQGISYRLHISAFGRGLLIPPSKLEEVYRALKRTNLSVDGTLLGALDPMYRGSLPRGRSDDETLLSALQAMNEHISLQGGTVPLLTVVERARATMSGSTRSTAEIDRIARVVRKAVDDVDDRMLGDVAVAVIVWCGAYAERYRALPGLRAEVQHLVQANIPIGIVKIASRDLPEPLADARIDAFDDGPDLWSSVARWIAYNIPPAPPTTIDRPVTHDQGGDPINHVIGSITRGRFVPIIGAGCYDLPASRVALLRHVEPRLDGVIAKSPIKGRGKVMDSRHHDFAESIAESMLGSAWGERDPRDPHVEDYDDTELRLIAFQRAFVRLGVLLTHHLAAGLESVPIGITNVSTFTIYTELTAEEHQKLVGAFKDVADALGALDKKLPEAADPTPSEPDRARWAYLGLPSIKRQLEKVRQQVLPAGHTRRRRGSRAGFRKADIVIPLSVLEWVGDLFWHTLRFDAMQYPRPDELAFSISLLTRTRTPPRRAELAAVSLLADEPERIKACVYWYRDSRGQGHTERPKPNEGVSSFYLTIVRAVMEHPLRLAEGESVEWPVLVNCNFDDELERLFREIGYPFHVLFPVWITCDGDSTREAVWLLHDEGQGARDGVWHLIGEPGRHELPQMQGPLIVKLHGSPCHPLPPGASSDMNDAQTWMVTDMLGAGARIDSMRHRLILSDYDYTRETVPGHPDSLPPGLRARLINKAADLVFLGYALTDLHHRLRMFDKLLRNKELLQCNEGHRIFLVVPPDDTMLPNDPRRGDAFVKSLRESDNVGIKTVKMSLQDWTTEVKPELKATWPPTPPSREGDS